MKKIISTLVIFLMMILLATTMVNAVTASSLADDLYALGIKYGVTSADKIKLERFLADNPVTDAQAETIYGKAKEAAAIMDNAGVTDVTKLSAADKKTVETKAQEAAAVVGATLTFKNGTVEVYKNGKKLEVFTFRDGKLAYTGNDVNTVLVVSSIAVVALATGFVVKKKFANA